MIFDQGEVFKTAYTALSHICKYVCMYLGIEKWLEKHNQSVNSFFPGDLIFPRWCSQILKHFYNECISFTIRKL